MAIELDQAVFPDAGSVFLKGDSCGATFDWDTQKWTVNTALDGCDTSMSTKEDGSLAFSNVLRLDAYSQGSAMTLILRFLVFSFLWQTWRRFLFCFRNKKGLFLVSVLCFCRNQ